MGSVLAFPAKIRISSEGLREKVGCLASCTACTHEKGVYMVQPNLAGFEGQGSSSRLSFCWPLSSFQGGVGWLSRGFGQSGVCSLNDITL